MIPAARSRLGSACAWPILLFPSDFADIEPESCLNNIFLDFFIS